MPLVQMCCKLNLVLPIEQQDHTRLATESNIFGADLSLRYGLLFETLELNYEGTFDNQIKNIYQILVLKIKEHRFLQKQNRVKIFSLRSI